MSQVLEPGASMDELMRRLDWGATPIGPVETWSPSLRTSISICLKSRFPMIIFWGPELVQVYNDAYAPVLGDKHPAALGQRAADCWPEIWDSIGPMLSGVLTTNEATWAENLLLPLRRNGQIDECYFTFSYSPIDEGGHAGGVFCAVTETTAAVLREREARERAEALAELDRAKTTFFSNVSHELRTPLTLMIGPLQELQQSASAEQRPLVDTAFRNSLRLLKLVNTLMQFARLEAGRTDAAFSETDLGSMTADIVSAFRSAVELVGLRLVVDMDLAVPVYVDRSMWERIVLNILSNAVKFTLDGEISVALCERAGYARLTVTDTGVGIPTSELPRIFERFHRAHGPRSRSHEGTGIGLALVNELVRIHGGSIGVESELGRGSTFSVEIPLGSEHLDPTLIVAEHPNAASSVAHYLADIEATVDRDDMAAITPDAPAAEGNVLVVDDNADLRAYLAHILKPFFNVVMARDGTEALSLLRAQPFDVVVSDIMMPEMDGFNLVDRIRSDPALEATRVLFLSGRAGDESATDGLKRGADDYIVKPFTADDVLARVRSQARAGSRTGLLAQSTFERWFDRAGDPTTNEAAFRVFADQLPIMLCQQDINGAISFTNRAWHDMLRLPRDPSSHTVEAWKGIIHPDDIERTLGIISAAIPDRQPWILDYRLRPAGAGQDDYRWYNARAFPYFTEAGEFRGWNCSIMDVHEAHVREEAERSLRLAAATSEREFRALADTVASLIWSADASGAVTWYNQRWYEYTGQSLEESVGWGWQALHHPDDFPLVMERWPKAVASGEPFEMEFRLRRFDGVFHAFLTRAVPVRNDAGKVYRWYGSSVDINDQKEALERSRTIARTLQGAFVPGPLPEAQNIRIDTVYQAAESDALVGGDWVDAIELPDGRYLLAIGDVTGHGLDASVVAARLRHAIIDFALHEHSPARVLENTNRILRLEHPNIYASALVGFIDITTWTFVYASAGHHGPMLARSGSTLAEPLQTDGMLLGIGDTLDLTDRNVDVRTDDVLALYTDGLIEFSRDLLGAELNVAAAVASLVNNPISQPAAFLRDTVLDGEPALDDVAILTLQFSRFTNAIPAPAPISDKARIWRFHSSDAAAAQQMRHELMRFLRSTAIENEHVFSTELILGELLANTVEHAPGMVEIEIDWGGEQAVVNVRDSGPGLSPELYALPGTDFDENGRGLFLIATLAGGLQVGASPGGGTEIEVILPLRRERRASRRVGTIATTVDRRTDLPST